MKKSGSPRLTLRGASRQLIVQVEASNDTTEPRVGTRGSLWAQPGAANHESKPRYGAMEFVRPRRKSWDKAAKRSPAPVRAAKGRLRFWCFGQGSGVTYRTGRIDPSLAFRARLLGFARIRAENSCGGVNPDSDAGHCLTNGLSRPRLIVPSIFSQPLTERSATGLPRGAVFLACISHHVARRSA